MHPGIAGEFAAGSLFRTEPFDQALRAHQVGHACTIARLAVAFIRNTHGQQETQDDAAIQQ